VQHPFWGDVSFFRRCEAAFFKTQPTPDPSGSPVTVMRAQFDQDLTCYPATPETGAFGLTILEV